MTCQEALIKAYQTMCKVEAYLDKALGESSDHLLRLEVESAVSGMNVFMLDEGFHPDAPQNIYEYTIVLKKADGSLTTETLGGTDDEHAREEASYECEGEIIAVQRGQFLHKNA